jgi:hypothetical protein
MNLAAIKNKKQGIQNSDDKQINLGLDQGNTNEGQKNGKKDKLPPIDHVKIKSFSNRALSTTKNKKIKKNIEID